jgi:hypothetical protein
MTFCIYVNGLIRPHSRYRAGVRFRKQKRILQKVYICVVDPEPDPDLRGSKTFHEIQVLDLDPDPKLAFYLNKNIKKKKLIFMI